MQQWRRVEFSKSMSDVERLRIIAILAAQPASAAQVADRLHVPSEDAQNHLTFLTQTGILTRLEDKYKLNDGRLLSLAQKQSTSALNDYIPAPNLDLKSLKTLAAYLNPDGTIRQIPSAPTKLKLLLIYLLAAFTPEADYTEKEVNTLLRRFHLDVAGLRRDLIESGLMARESDGSRYWRSHG